MNNILTSAASAISVIFDSLQLTDMADAADGRAADAANALGHDVDGGKNGIGLLVEEQVIVAEVRTGEVPVEVLRLDVERERIGDERLDGLHHHLRLPLHQVNLICIPLRCLLFPCVTREHKKPFLANTSAASTLFPSPKPWSPLLAKMYQGQRIEA